MGQSEAAGYTSIFVAPLFVAQSSAEGETGAVVDQRREPLTQSQAEKTYGMFAINMMIKMGVFAEHQLFYDPQCQLPKYVGCHQVCTAGEKESMLKKKRKKVEDPPDYSNWKCSYDGVETWHKTGSRTWFCPNCKDKVKYEHA